MMANGGFDPAGDVQNKLLKNRIVILGSEVNDQIANLISAQLLYLDGEDDSADIWLYINSPGGSVTAGLAIYDTMNFIKPNVATVCMGLAASMGQFLLCAGEKGKRFALPSARIMMHQPSGGFQGQASDIERHARDILKMKRKLNEVYVKHCGRTYEEVEQTLDRDHFMSADEAKDWGLVDRVISSRVEAEGGEGA